MISLSNIVYVQKPTISILQALEANISTKKLSLQARVLSRFAGLLVNEESFEVWILNPELQHRITDAGSFIWDDARGLAFNYEVEPEESPYVEDFDYNAPYHSTVLVSALLADKTDSKASLTESGLEIVRKVNSDQSIHPTIRINSTKYVCNLPLNSRAMNLPCIELPNREITSAIGIFRNGKPILYHLDVGLYGTEYVTAHCDLYRPC